MDLSPGRASPTPAAINRCGSRVWFSLITVNATCPGLRCFKPSVREISLQCGGKIEETRTMLQAAMPALRSANSKLERRSRCFPTPLVRNIFFATNAMDWLGSASSSIESEIFFFGKLTSAYCEVNHYSCMRVTTALQKRQAENRVCYT